MAIKQVKNWLCVVCKLGIIEQSQMEHPLEGDVPDISSCDFSTYTDRKVEGGRLLKSKPAQFWKRVTWYTERDPELNVRRPPIGGICDNCLKNPLIAALVAGNHIKFEEK